MRGRFLPASAPFPPPPGVFQPTSPYSWHPVLTVASSVSTASRFVLPTSTKIPEIIPGNQNVLFSPSCSLKLKECLLNKWMHACRHEWAKSWLSIKVLSTFEEIIAQTSRSSTNVTSLLKLSLTPTSGGHLSFFWTTPCTLTHSYACTYFIFLFHLRVVSMNNNNSNNSNSHNYSTFTMCKVLF